jgi:hypothetical protein
MNSESELVKSFIAIDVLGRRHNVSMYVETPVACNVPPRPIPRFQTERGLALEPLDELEERFKIFESGVLLRPVGPFAP